VTDELDDLIAQQRRDRGFHQDPQRFAGRRTVSLDKFIDKGRDSSGDGGETVRGSVDPRSKQYGDAGKPLATLHQDRIRRLYRGRDRAAIARAFEPFLGVLTAKQRDVVRLVYYGELSQRTAGTALGGITGSTVNEHLRAAERRLRPAVERAAGSEGMDFPAERPLDTEGRCRIPGAGIPGARAGYCGGHFAPTTCGEPGCVTALPRHYNAYQTCCVHTGLTRYGFVCAWLVGDRPAEPASRVKRAAPAPRWSPAVGVQVVPVAFASVRYDPRRRHAIRLAYRVPDPEAPGAHHPRTWAA
jgi:DNA-binding CsgD family transcriptional regulator